MNQNPRRILLVDNDELVLNSLAARLESAGYQVTSVVNALQAISIFRADPPDLVIADINMPGLDGIGLAEDIRSFADVPILLITAYPEDYPYGAEHLAMVEIVAKPFAWADLARRMEEMMREAA